MIQRFNLGSAAALWPDLGLIKRSATSPLTERKHNTVHVSGRLISCLMTHFICRFGRDLLTMLCLSESPKCETLCSWRKLPLHQTWEINSTSSGHLSNAFSLSPRNLHLFWWTFCPQGPKQQPAVCIVTCTSGLSSCHIVCKKKSYGIMKTKVCSLSASAEGESASVELLSALCTLPDLLCNSQAGTLLSLMFLSLKDDSLKLQNKYFIT